MLRKKIKELLGRDKPSQEKQEWEQAMLEQTFAPNPYKHPTLTRNARTFAVLNQGNTPAPAPKKPQAKLNTSKSARELRINKDAFTRQPAVNETLTRSPRVGKRV